MKIPYGMSNFKAMREEGYLYVDKTMYIEKIENLNSKYIFYIRPRRFGKSLFLSTLEHYYDINAEKDFDKLYGDLYIGKNPTKLKNKYMVLELDFSGLDTDSREKLQESFRLSLINSIVAFLYKYKNFVKDIDELMDKLPEIKDIGSILKTLFNEVKKTGKKIYLIIDEYDHFANDIIAMGDSTFYKDIIRASGFVRDFYETVKIGTKSVIDRIFITGISPIMLDDLTSGFNIALNATMDLSLNEMLGFTEEEVSKIIDEIGIVSEDKTKEELIEELRQLYNGYLFNKNGRARVYNPDMVLYYFDSIVRYKKPPENLIDDNVKTDYGRLNRLSMNEENRVVLQRIIEDEVIVSDIVTKFSFDRMYDQEYFVSLLFYMGLLTIGRQEKTRLLLQIPNYVIKTIMWEYIEISIKKTYNIRLDLNTLRKSIEDMAYEGEIKPYIDYISENVLKILSNRDMINFDEKYIKIILLTYIVNSMAYRPISERETENGYIDIYLEKDIRIPDIKYEWFIELKYIKKANEKNIEEVLRKGQEQLKEHADSIQFKDKQNIKKALVVFIGKGDYKLIYY